MIHRAEHNDNFTVIANDAIRSQLSDGAFRLLAFMLSCSDDWDFNIKGLATCLEISTGTVCSRVKELQSVGFVVINKSRTRNGKINSWTWDVYENPHSKIPNVVKPDSNLPNVVLPNVEKLNDKEITNIRNNKGKNTNSRTKPHFKIPNVEEIESYCQERKNGINAQAFFDYYESKGWKVGKSPMKDWRAAVRTWESRNKARPQPIKQKNDWLTDYYVKAGLVEPREGANE